MHSATYTQRRGELETYFDRTAAAAWVKLTSDAPLGRIRATVRAGRDDMRATLLSWLPPDLRGKTVLDAGAGTGALSVEMARRGAAVTAIDLAGTLVDLAQTRIPFNLGEGSVRFLVGDMLDPALGRFDHIVCMDSLIHYRAPDVVRAVAGLAARAETSVLFTFAPRTPMLSVMHAVGRLFPRSDRAPAIEPVGAQSLGKRLANDAALAGWKTGRSRRIASGFYTSQALEVIRA
jgi:magnesium-protoporphyrin O-methyltransferase